MRIVSVPGRLVRDPVTRRPVDSDGIDIDPADPYWARVLADGDVAGPTTDTPKGKAATTASQEPTA